LSTEIRDQFLNELHFKTKESNLDLHKYISSLTDTSKTVFLQVVLPYMGYRGMCGPKGYGFSAVLVINRRVWVLHSSLDMGIFLRSVLFIINEKKINKSPSQDVFTVISLWSELGNLL